jgi:hypothetical protein
MVAFIELSIFLVGTFLAMSMLSTLYGKGNPLYSFAEESYIGFATGLTVIESLNYIYRTGIIPVLGGDYAMIIGLLLGCMMLFRLSKEHSYLSRIPVAVAIGGQLGLNLRTTIFTGFTQQISSVLVPLFGVDAKTMLYNWTIVICIIFMLTFFFYTLEFEGALGTSAKIGEYLLYTAFGGIFAQTFMGRLGMFVGFMQSFTEPAWEKPYLVVFMLGVFALVVILDKTGLAEKYTPEE